jgi:hypothetical protein
VAELDALTLAVLVELTLDVNSGIGATCACTGVAEDKQIHAQSFPELVEG